MNYDLLKSCLADQGVTMIGKDVVRELLGEAESLLADLEQSWVAAAFISKDLDSSEVARAEVARLRIENANFDRHAQERAREHAREVARLRNVMAVALERVQQHGEEMPSLDRAALERLLGEALRL